MHPETIAMYNSVTKSNKAEKIKAYDDLVASLAAGLKFENAAVNHSLSILAGAFTPAKPTAKKSIFGWVAQGASKDPNKTVLQNIKSTGKAIFATDGHRGFIAYTKDYEKGYYMQNAIPTSERGNYPDLLGFIPKPSNNSIILEYIEQKHRDQETSTITCPGHNLPIDILVTTKIWNEFINGWEEGAKLYYINDEERVIIRGKVLGVKCVAILMPLCKERP